MKLTVEEVKGGIKVGSTSDLKYMSVTDVIADRSVKASCHAGHTQQSMAEE